MKTSILYRPDSEFARMVEEYVHDFKRTKGYNMELVDLNTQAGADLAKLYDVMQYPTILIIRDDGQLIKSWQGEQMPLMTEVAGYLV